jgi:hypothetical protein
MLEADPASRKEGMRRVVVGLLFVFYGLLLAEGPLRKWVVPATRLSSCATP